MQKYVKNVINKQFQNKSLILNVFLHHKISLHGLIINYLTMKT